MLSNVKVLLGLKSAQRKNEETESRYEQVKHKISVNGGPDDFKVVASVQF